MKKLVIIGGGFAGAKIAKALENKFETTLIDRKDYFEFTPSILRAIINPNHLKKIQIFHTHYLHKTKIINDCVTNISLNQVKTKNHTFNFDYLIIASGSSYNTPFKEKDVVIATRGNKLRDYNSNLEKSKSITIIGGGLVGIELAGEIINFNKNKQVTIIHSGEKLILRNHQKATKLAEKYLKKHNIKVIYNETAEKKSKGTIITNKGTKIKSDLTFLCTGITPNSEFAIKNFSNNIDGKKFIKVNSFLQLENQKNIFSAGDVNNIKEEKTAQNAEKQAEIIIKNICRLENNKNLIKYISKKNPMVISLGKYNGIFEYKSFIFSGLIPAFLKWFIERKTMMRYRN